MKRILVVMLVGVFAFGLAGCSKKQSSEMSQEEPLTMEALSAMNVSVASATNQTVAPAATTTTMPQIKPAVETQQVVSKLQPLPPTGPYKPTAQQIQAALKNANYYTGAVDGKVGPKTKKAIEEFQKANNLTADGKVGLKTWELLSKFLVSDSSAPAQPQQ